MTTIRKALAVGATVAAALIAIEVVAHVYYAVAQGPLHSAARAANQAAAPVPLGARPPGGNQRHPFEALTSSDPKAERNSYPPHPGGGTFVIGVFGGDAARDVAPALKQAVAEELALLGVDIEPVVLDFAKDHGRQPQQLMAAIGRFIYSAQLDVLVNLDGVNEMNWRRDSTLDHHPHSSIATMAELRLLSEIAALQEQQTLSAEARGGLGLFSGVDLQRDLRQREAELAAVSTRYSLERHGPRRGWTANMQLAGAARQWFRSSALIAGLAEAMGADYYHLLQPSRHIAGGEELSTEPRDRASSEHPAEDHPYVAMHPLLVELGRDLAAQGIAFFDLANAFAGEDEALYADLCCRLTQRGSALLAASVLRRIAPSIVAASQAGKENIDADERRVADQLLVAAHYDIFARGPRHLVYKRADCADADVQAPFFLDVFPLRSEDMDDEFANRGFEQAAFDFSGNLGTRTNQRCVVEQRLPNYPIELLRTGQRDATTGEPVWQTWVQLDAAPVDRFKVFLRGIHGIVYKKPNCVAADMQRQFFLHALPAPGVDGADFYSTTPDGYVNMDFEVALDVVAQSGGSCVFEHEVPFEFARLRTGQTKPGSFERLWRREIERP